MSNPLYHFKLAFVVLHMAVKNFLTPTTINGEIDRFNLESHFLPALKISCSVLLPKALKHLFFVLVVFITAENVSCIHIKQ